MSDLFMKREGLRRIDCAEAIVRQYRDRLGVDESLDIPSRGWGKGKAPEGHCGALYAARALLEAAGRSDELAGLYDLFEREAGNADCRIIRKARIASCAHCVAIAGRYLEACAQQRDEPAVGEQRDG